MTTKYGELGFTHFKLKTLSYRGYIGYYVYIKIDIDISPYLKLITGFWAYLVVGFVAEPTHPKLVKILVPKWIFGKHFPKNSE